MSPAVKTVIALLVVAAAGLIGLWAYHNLERYEEEIDIGLRGEALRNPLLAAGRLMEHYGANVHFSPGYVRPPPAGATLVWPASREALAPGRAQALLNWVHEGGHLIVVSWTLWEDEDADPLLDPFGVRQYLNDEYWADEDESDTDSDADETPEAEAEAKPEPPAVVLPRGEGVLRIAFDPEYRLEDANGEAEWALEDEYGIHALHYRHGAGRVTALSDHLFFENDRIGKADHAALIYRLVEPREGATVWFIYGGDAPSLWAWLVDHAWPVLLAGLCLLIAWLWRASRRLGPRVPLPVAGRRSMVEHVTASGRFLWSRQVGQDLYKAAVEAFLRQVQLRHPQWAALAPDELAEQAAAMTALPIDRVRQALDTGQARNEAGFTQDLHLIETLRKRL